MTSNKKKASSYVAITFVLAVLFGCESNFKEVQKSTLSEFAPSGEADSLTLKYTDSGKIKAVLVSSKMLDFSSVEFPFTEFPKGVDVTTISLELLSNPIMRFPINPLILSI